MPFRGAVDLCSLQRVLRHGLQSSVEGDEAERQRVPDSVNHQHGPHQRGRAFETERGIIEDVLDRRTDHAVSVDHPEQDQRTDQRGDEKRQEGDENRNSLERAWQIVDANGDCQSQHQHKRRHNEGIGQREGERVVERQVVDLAPERPHAVRIRPSLADIGNRQMRAIEVGVQPVEPAQWLLFAELLGGFEIDRRGFGAAEWAAAFRDHLHLFMGDEQGLHKNRDDRQCDEEDHRRERRQDEPEKGAMLHGVCPG